MDPHPAAGVAEVGAGPVDGAVGDRAQPAVVGLDALDEAAALDDIRRQFDLLGGTGRGIQGHQLGGSSSAHPYLAVLSIQAPGVVALGSDPPVLGELLGGKVHGVCGGVRISGAEEGVPVHVEGAKHVLVGDAGGDLHQLLRLRGVPP